MRRIKAQAWAALRAKPDLPSTEPSSALEDIIGTSFLCWVFTPIHEVQKADDRTKFEEVRARRLPHSDKKDGLTVSHNKAGERHWS